MQNENILRWLWAYQQYGTVENTLYEKKPYSNIIQGLFGECRQQCTSAVLIHNCIRYMKY